MKEHFNKLSPAQLERLALLMEECAEVQHVIGKIIRHGYHSHHPDNPEITNRQLLEKEMGDLEYALLLISDRDVSGEEVYKHRHAKRFRIGKYLHHQNEE